MKTELRKIKMEQGKTCSKCHTWKPLSEYHKRGFNSSGQPRLRSECRDCKQDYERKNPRVRYNDPMYCVYYLPAEDYVGMTNNFKERMHDHRSKNGRDITGVIKVFESKSSVEAHLVETLLHSFGFDGYHTGRSKDDIKVNPQIKLFDIYKLRQQQ